MCGICGVVNPPDQPVDESLLTTMRDRLTHRGPDDAGNYVVGHVGIAMRRLSIIDLSSGHQPIFNEDGTIGVVYNGEIYNFRELRETLIAKGHRFQTESDTEVLVHLYEEYGDDCVDHLNGMFGFAIWDRNRQRLFVARDRLGIKPLYYAVINGMFLFASELKSLLAHPDVPREIDPHSFAEYLTFEYVPAPRSIFKHIKKLLPAHRLVLENGSVSISPYWDVQFDPDPALGDENTCSEAIRDQLREATRLRLRSDVPLGVLLSGGIDSSSVVAMMSDLNTTINTFSIGFEDKRYNELDAASAVARQFNTNHRFLELSGPDVMRLLPSIIDYLDEPLADASIVPTYLVCQLARQHVTVALSGDGGDETFGGYETYRAHKLARYYRWLPGLIRRGVRRAVDWLPASKSHRGFSFKAQKFASGARFAPAVANTLWWGAYPPEQRRRIMSPDKLNGHDPFAPIYRVEEEFAGGALLDRIFYCDMKLYLQDDLLVKVDRMSMANSLEVRVPFLDHNMVEFAARVPHKLKVKGWKLKYILRRAMSTKLPESITQLPKRGFDIPLDNWMRGPLREFVGDTLSRDRLVEGGLLHPDRVTHVLNEHLSGAKNHRQFLWPLIIFESWRQKYI